MQIEDCGAAIVSILYSLFYSALTIVQDEFVHFFHQFVKPFLQFLVRCLSLLDALGSCLDVFDEVGEKCLAVLLVLFVSLERLFQFTDPFFELLVFAYQFVPLIRLLIVWLLVLLSLIESDDAARL